MNTFILRKCKSAILDKDLFSNHNMETLTIEDIEELSIMERSVKLVKNLTIKSVANVLLDRKALDYLRADKVVFDNVTVAKPSVPRQVHSEIHPEKVASHFIINDSYLPSGVSLKINSDGDNDDLLVSIHNCRLGTPDVFEVKSSRFEMIGNKFNETWTGNKVVVRYEKQVVLNSNSLMSDSLPDITLGTTDASFELLVKPVERKMSKTAYRQWFQTLGLVHNGIAFEEPDSKCFESEGSRLMERRIICQSQQSMESFLKTDRFFKLFFRESRLTGESGATHCSNSIFLLVVTVIVALVRFE